MNVFQEMTPVIFILTGIVSSGCGLFLSLELALTILPWAAALLQGLPSGPAQVELWGADGSYCHVYGFPHPACLGLGERPRATELFNVTITLTLG